MSFTMNVEFKKPNGMDCYNETTGRYVGWFWGFDGPVPSTLSEGCDFIPQEITFNYQVLEWSNDGFYEMSAEQSQYFIDWHFAIEAVHASPTVPGDPGDPEFDKDFKQLLRELMDLDCELPQSAGEMQIAMTNEQEPESPKTILTVPETASNTPPDHNSSAAEQNAVSPPLHDARLVSSLSAVSVSPVPPVVPPATPPRLVKGALLQGPTKTSTAQSRVPTTALVTTL